MSNISKQNLRQKWLNRLAKVECPDTTFITHTFPTVLKKGKGIYVIDVNNKKYLDFISGFGSLALGHRSNTTLKAIKKQSAFLIQGLGDFHPNESKIKLLELLAKISPYECPKSMLGLSGGDAVEIAMKTAILATNRTEFISFDGAYHGLQLAPLNLNHSSSFTEGFENFLKNRATYLPFPYFIENGPQIDSEPMHDPNDVLNLLEEHLRSKKYAALILEPIQGRGGIRVFTKSFLQKCKFLCQTFGTLLIFDEILTGFGRTGKMFGYEHSQVIPDLICIGKAMGGGFPLSACIGNIIDVWKKSQGEAKHTQTFLGHPLSCAVGYETILSIQKNLPKFQNESLKIEEVLNHFATKYKNQFPFFVRGKGFMHGLFFYTKPQNFGITLMENLYEKSILALPEGAKGEVLALIPSLIMTSKYYKIFLNCLFNQILKTL